MFKPIPIGATAALLIAGSASAAITASATSDLNLRAGPGPEFAVMHVITGSDAVLIEGCITASQWCLVNHGAQGWVYAAYLNAPYAGTPVVVGASIAALGLATFAADAAFPYYRQVAVVTAPPATVTLGAVSPIVIEPAPVVIQPIVPPQFVQIFIRSSTLASAYINAPLFIGQTLPPEILLVEVPAYQYGYAYVNGLAVLVDPLTRQIVYIAA
jgi:uncharacterized protein YraI